MAAPHAGTGDRFNIGPCVARFHVLDCLFVSNVISTQDSSLQTKAWPLVVSYFQPSGPPPLSLLPPPSHQHLNPGASFPRFPLVHYIHVHF